MRSFTTTIPLFMNALSTVLILSLVDTTLSAAVITARDHHHHHHNHIRTATTTHININNHKNDENKGYPSMPSVSSRLFTYGKLADKFLLVNDAYLKDGWQSSLEVANAEAELGIEEEGSRRLGLDDADSDADDSAIRTVIAGPPPSTPVPSRSSGVSKWEGYHNHPYGHDLHDHQTGIVEGQDVSEYYYQQPPNILITTPRESGNALNSDPAHSAGAAVIKSAESKPRFPQPHHQPHHKACKLLRKKIRSGLASRLSSYAGSIQRGVVRLFNVHLAIFGVDLRRKGERFFPFSFLW